MSNLSPRVSALEQNQPKAIQECFTIICEGEIPTPDEQAQIDEAEAQGKFVVCYRIIDPPKYEL
jgi:hypothetical protein